MLGTVATKHEGIDALLEQIEIHYDFLQATGRLIERRRERAAGRAREVLERATRQWLWAETDAERIVIDRLNDIVAGHVSPYDLADEVVEGLKQGTRL
ncbi:MAG: hypothetical protein HKM89_13520 [Gemmatimonadales bacterium]|nr:hypothetical protein [Gemmatimonadales bacterium]